MKVRFMQIVDRWVGVPLCVALSFVAALGRLLRGKHGPFEPRRVLCIELSEMGSAILAHSALEYVKDRLRAEELYFVVFKRNRESVEVLGTIPPERIISIDDSSFSKFALGALKALVAIRRLRIDTTVDLELFSRFTAMFAYLTGARMRVGFHNYTAEGLYRGELLTHKVFYNAHQHMSLNFLALVAALGKPDIHRYPLVKEDVRDRLLPLPRFAPTEAELDGVWNLLRKQRAEIDGRSILVLVNPDPGDAIPIRGWPAERFCEVASALLKSDPRVYIGVIGLKRSKPYATLVAEQTGSSRVLDLTGKTKTLRDLLALFTISHLLVTNDSGPAHLASLTPLPSVTLFGPETPALYSPLSPANINLFSNYACSPCLSAFNHRHTPCGDSQCLKAISVEQVLEASFKLLDEQRQGRPAALRIVPHNAV